MGLSKSTEKKKETPFVTEPMAGAFNNYIGDVGQFADADPYQYYAPASQNEQKAFAGVANLGAWQAPAQQALNMAQSAGSAGASTYQPTKLGPAAQAQGVSVAEAPKVNAESLLTNFNAYMNPYTKNVLDATLADFDAEAGRREAALQAAGAGASAFGGSRWGTAEGQFGADALRARASTGANILDRGFGTAAQLANLDADRRQGASFFNIGNTQQRNLAQAGFDWNRSMFNTGAENDFKLAQGTFDNEAARYNAQAGEAALQRAMQAAGLTANIGSDIGAQSRADLGLTADIGTLQREIEQLKLGAPISQLQTVGSLLGIVPYQSYTGVDTYVKSKPSLFSQIMQAGQKVGNAMAAGAG